MVRSKAGNISYIYIYVVVVAVVAVVVASGDDNADNDCFFHPCQQGDLRGTATKAECAGHGSP